MTKQATQPAPAQAEALHVFRYDVNAMPRIADISGHVMNDFSEGLPAYLLQREYRLLPGLTPAIETYESSESSERFCIVARYGALTLVVYCGSLNAYTRFMQEYTASFSVWPALFMPEQTQGPNNLITEYPIASLRPKTW